VAAVEGWQRRQWWNRKIVEKVVRWGMNSEFSTDGPSIRTVEIKLNF
jgi:hypothetical protein